MAAGAFGGWDGRGVRRGWGCGVGEAARGEGGVAGGCEGPDEAAGLGEGEVGVGSVLGHAGFYSGPHDRAKGNQRSWLSLEPRRL